MTAGASRPRTVVLRALGLGDFLTAVPALRALRRARPDDEVLLLAPAALRGLVACAAVADEVADVSGLAAALPEALHRPALAVNLHGRGPESHQRLLALEPERLVAYACSVPPAPVDGPQWEDDEHEVARWCRLLTASGWWADPDDLDVTVPTEASPVRAHDGVTVVHPGAAAPARRWPAARWGAVAEAEAAAGRQVVITGSPTERELAGEVARRAGLPATAVLAGRTDLVGLLALAAGAGRVLCGDTGMAHVATAVRTPSVVLFGPTDPARWGPPANRPWHRVLWTGRVGDPHGRRPDPGLLDIGVDDVLTALASLPLPA